jgi:hypothetical protein
MNGDKQVFNASIDDYSNALANALGDGTQVTSQISDNSDDRKRETTGIYISKILNQIIFVCICILFFDFFLF